MTAALQIDLKHIDKFIKEKQLSWTEVRKYTYINICLNIYRFQFSKFLEKLTEFERVMKPKVSTGNYFDKYI